MRGYAGVGEDAMKQLELAQDDEERFFRLRAEASFYGGAPSGDDYHSGAVRMMTEELANGHGKTIYPSRVGDWV